VGESGHGSGADLKAVRRLLHWGGGRGRGGSLRGFLLEEALHARAQVLHLLHDDTTTQKNEEGADKKYPQKESSRKKHAFYFSQK
jgi:hypothetical protein